MSSKTIRFPIGTATLLRRLAELEGSSAGIVLQRAVERYEEERFWREYAHEMADPRADPVSWAEWQAEVAVLDGTPLDGLTGDPY